MMIHSFRPHHLQVFALSMSLHCGVRGRYNETNLGRGSIVIIYLGNIFSQCYPAKFHSGDLLFPCADWIFAQFRRHILKCASIKKLENCSVRHLWHIYISHPKGQHDMIYQSQRNFKFLSAAISHQTRKNKSSFWIWTGIRTRHYPWYRIRTWDKNESN